KHSSAEKRHVLDAQRAGRADWLGVAANNGITRSMAYRIVDTGRVDDLPRGGARAGSVKVAQEVKERVESYLNDNCTYTLETLRSMLIVDEGIQRGRGRAKKGKRATAVLPPSKDANLQVQCTVNSERGVVLYRLERGSIRMEQNAAFIDDIYRTVKASAFFRENYEGKKVVVVLDNAPAHRQTEERVAPHDDLVLLRLAPYSPMCNPIEGCFSVLKARIKEHLALDREAICDRSNMTDVDGNLVTIKKRTMRFLERAAHASIKHITPTIVTKMELHARDAVNAAELMQDMVY
ncbi:hypothetical protein PHYSODRAFT_533223, partial [Phytophthora sojae]